MFLFFEGFQLCYFVICYETFWPVTAKNNSEHSLSVMKAIGDIEYFHTLFWGE